MLVHLKRRVGVLSAVAVMAAFLPVLASSVASAIPATALSGGAAVENSATYSACPAGSAAAAGFTDTTSTDVDCIAMHGITTGVTATTYEPTANVPRWQMALYLTRMATSAGVTLGSGADQGFTDISGYSAAIQTAINQIKQLGVTVGKTATTYAPDDNVTREEMALFLDRALATMAAGSGGTSDAGGNSLLGVNVNSTTTGTGQYNYDDIDAGSVTFEGHNSIVEIYQLGITGDLTTVRAFNPSSAITRATMATWVTNALAHTNARPAGLWLQSAKYAGFANATPSLSASYRDSDRNPVAGKVVDFYSWENAATVADNSAHTAAGACATAAALAHTWLTKGKVEVGDPTTNTQGNIPAWNSAVSAGKTMSYFAWSAAAGTTFVLATHGSGTEYSTIDISSTAPATLLVLSTDTPAMALNSGASAYKTTVKYGSTVTITAQMSAAKVGAAYPAVAQPLNKVTFTHTIHALGGDVVESVTTTNVLTDASGTATYSFTDADPLATANTGATRHLVVVSDAGGMTETSAATAGYNGHFVGGTTAEWSFDDAAVAYNTTTLATNLSNYKAGSTLLPVARSATSTNWDQYGGVHTASASNTVKFQGAAVSGTGLLVCVSGNDLCYFQGRQITAETGDDEITLDANDLWTMKAGTVHGLSVGDAVAFAGTLSTKMDDGLDTNTVYYVKTAPNTTTFTTATVSSGGSITNTANAVDDCAAATCRLYQVEPHSLEGTESIVFRTAATEVDDTFTANTRYYVAAAGLTSFEFGLNTTANADAKMDIGTTPADNCTLTTCEAYLWHAGSGSPARSIGPDGTASVAWNDTTSTSGLDSLSVYVSTTKEAAKSSYRYIAPVVGTTLADSHTATTWVEDEGNDAGQLIATPLIHDAAGNTLLVSIAHGRNNLTETAGPNVHTIATHGTEYLQYSYDDNDQFMTTADATSAAATMAEFEAALAACKVVGDVAGVSFSAADIYGVTAYQALAGNVSTFKLGTCS